MQGRNRSVHATRLNQRTHVTVEQSQQQGTDVGAVHVRIGHHNDLAIAGRLQIEGTTRTGTNHLNQRRALGVREHIGHRGTLSVQNLTANRQQSLVRGRTRQTRSTQRRVTLHNEQLRMLHIGRTAVHQLSGHGRRLQRGLTALSFLMDARRDAGLHLRDDLLAQSGRLSLLRTGGRLQASLQRITHDLRHDLANRRGTQNLLGLTLKLRLGKTHGQHGGQAGEHVILLNLVVTHLVLAGIIGKVLAHHAQQALLKTGGVSTALGGGNNIHEAADRRLVANAPAQRNVHFAIALHVGQLRAAVLTQHRHGLGERSAAAKTPGVGNTLIVRQKLDELTNAAVVLENFLVGLQLAGGAGQSALIADANTQTRNEERGLARTSSQVLIAELSVGGENLWVSPIAHTGAGHAALSATHNLQGVSALGCGSERIFGLGGAAGLEEAGNAVAERHLVGLRATIHLHVQAGRQCVHHGSAHTVQTTGRVIGATAKLTAGVQLSEHDLHTGQAGARLNVGGDTAAIIAHLNRTVTVQNDLNGLAETGERLIHRVVDNLPEAVHQAARVGGANVHARAFAYSFQTFQHGEVTGGVVRRRHGNPFG